MVSGAGIAGYSGVKDSALQQLSSGGLVFSMEVLGP